jgi:hypothetical protein
MKRSRRSLPSVIVAGLALSGIAVSFAGPTDSMPVSITETQCLRKMSLDLTNSGPTDAEIAELESGAVTLDAMADRYMATPQFSQVVFNWYRGQFPPTANTATGTDTEEPARIARYIVVNDHDYREIVNGTYTVAADGATVQQVTDRPTAGVISTTHYMSAYSGSFRRNWAGHFLKEWGGIVLTPVTLAPDDGRDLSPTSLLNDPQCSGCHGNPVYGVDHLAAFAQCYGATGALDPNCTTDAGSFLTRTGNGLTSLGTIVAESMEFKSQAINFFYQRLIGRQIAKEETEFYVEAAKAFTTSGYQAKKLIKFLVTSDVYCAQ